MLERTFLLALNAGERRVGLVCVRAGQAAIGLVDAEKEQFLPRTISLDCRAQGGGNADATLRIDPLQRMTPEQSAIRQLARLKTPCRGRIAGQSGDARAWPGTLPHDAAI